MASPELSPATRAPWPKREGGIERGDDGAPARTRSVARVVGQRRKLARKRRKNVEVAGVEEDGEERSLQRLQAGEMASPERGGGLGGVAQAWEGLELPRRPEGITGVLELEDGGPRPARPGYGFLLDRGVCVSAGWCSRRLGVALFIGERRGCFGLRRWTPVHGARR